jgi:hypothetical protein
MLHTKKIAAYYLLCCLLITLTSKAKITQDNAIDIAFDHLLFENDPDITITKENATTRTRPSKKDWTFIAYVAADNDLRSFASRNIKQMAAVGSTEHINILVHLDIKTNTHQKITHRYLVKNKELIQVNPNDPSTQRMDSGNPETLISCCKWAIEEYPAEHYALVFWNHGTGPIDPPHGKVINPASLFNFNPFLNKLELDRSMGFLELIAFIQEEQRGVCWDDSTGNYLSNQKIEYALNTVCNTLLQGKTFDIIAFDACLMSSIEIAHLLKNYSHYMVSSQEVELGTGWNYQYALAPFQEQTLSPEDFACHLVGAYRKAYMQITNDYTQSALDLSICQDLENNIHRLANLLLSALQNQKNNSVKNLIKSSCTKILCTHFDEPSYKDLHHMYSNLLLGTNKIRLNNTQSTEITQKALQSTLQQGLAIIDHMVIANVTGKNLTKAKGVSIYLPDNRMHNSYRSSPFARASNWLAFIEQVIRL